MANAQDLRSDDAKAALQLVGELHELRELGPDAQIRHYVRRMETLIQSHVMLCAWDRRRVDGKMQWKMLRGSLDGTWDDHQLKCFANLYLADDQYQSAPQERKMFERDDQSFALLERRQHIRDEEWYASPHVNEVRIGEFGMNDMLLAGQPLGRGLELGIGWNRPVSDGGFNPREMLLAELLTHHLAAFWRVVLPVWAGLVPAGTPAVLVPTVQSLSPRLWQTLDALLDGQSDKQIAARLGISRHTAHEYAGRVMETFGVNSRLELLSLFLRPPAEWPRARAAADAAES